MNITLDLYELKKMINELSEIWEAKYINAFSPELDRISERTAYKIFGETTVKRWVDDGRIDFRRRGSTKNSKKEYSYSELVKVKKTDTTIKKISKMGVEKLRELNLIS